MLENYARLYLLVRFNFSVLLTQKTCAMLDMVGSRKVLTVGEFDDFAKRGGMINLNIADNKISFVINSDAARRAGLSISSQLFK